MASAPWSTFRFGKGRCAECGKTVNGRARGDEPFFAGSHRCKPRHDWGTAPRSGQVMTDVIPRKADRRSREDLMKLTDDELMQRYEDIEAEMVRRAESIGKEK